MILSALLLVICAWQCYIGYNRGLLLQAYYSLASLLSVLVAYFNYRPLAQAISLWVPYSNPTQESVQSFFTQIDLLQLDGVFYNGVAFFTIYLAVYLLCRFLGILVHFAKLDRWAFAWSRWVAAGLSLLVTLVSLSMFFNILATITQAGVQGLLTGSPMVTFLVKGFWPFTQLIQTWWTVGI
ncbi:CvpA family protein [Streptococcus sp. DD12]|uniref:CvpA family protein n=1 Tax=Streptococcus sp. DD12 TaxID=1777880 RepID=UPI00079A8E56|nr:CvpA family protein [Streptococcus sp. DD12]KXT75684.1 Colicin V production protein [Streptococcus sp. DD12]